VEGHAGKQALARLLRLILPEPEAQTEDPNELFFRELKKAKQEMELAYLVFKEVTDLDLINLAVLRMKFSEERFRYLLRQARQNGITTPAWGKRDTGT